MKDASVRFDFSCQLSVTSHTRKVAVLTQTMENISSVYDKGLTVHRQSPHSPGSSSFSFMLTLHFPLSRKIFFHSL